MHKNRYLLVIFFILSSCSSFEVNEKDFTRQIGFHKKHFGNTIVVKVYSNGPYDLLVPFRKLSGHIHFGSDGKYQKFLKYADSLLWSHRLKKATIIDLPKEFTYPAKFDLLLTSLFRYGEISIYDNHSKKYVKEVRIRESSYYGGPLAAGFDFWVYIGDFIFYEMHMNA